jgi:hypothetical protein
LDGESEDQAAVLNTDVGRSKNLCLLFTLKLSKSQNVEPRFIRKVEMGMASKNYT